MADNYVRTQDELDQDELDINNNSEPATSHDVVEGGGIGLVGGAIVGALAGGPLGAVIGAIAGGAASAAAVSVVDKHDHDYARTVANDNDLNDGIADTRSAYATGLANDPTIPVGYPAAYDDALDADYRNHYQTVYGSANGAYDEFQPAYRYGYDLANDPRYVNNDWDTVENNARADWETRHEGTWDRFKDSVRYAWDSVRGRHHAARNVGVYDNPNG